MIYTQVVASIAKERVGRPDATAYSWRMLTVDEDGIDGCKVEIGDVPLYVRGGQAGKPNWNRITHRQEIIVPAYAIEAWYEEHPDVCRRCGNERQVVQRWHHLEGFAFKPCPDCRAVTA